MNPLETRTQVQIGGHANTIQFSQETITKTSLSSEISFYLNLPLKLVPFTPKLISFSDTSLTLENLTLNFVSPCIIDLKLGTRLYSDIVPDSKKLKMLQTAIDTTSFLLGIRLVGAQIIHDESNTDIIVDRDFGKSLNSDTLSSGILKCFTNSNGNLVSRWVIELILEKLTRIEEIFRELDGFRFYGGSILIVYEGNVAWTSEINKNAVVLKLIDFAHSQLDAEGVDVGALKGIETLKLILERL